MNQTTVALLGILCSLVAVWAESRQRNNSQEVRERDAEASWWRESAQALKGHLAHAESRIDTLETSMDSLRQWCIAEVQARGAPEEKRKKGGK